MLSCAAGTGSGTFLAFASGEEREMYLYQKPAFRPVKSRHASAMKPHRSFGNRQAQTNSAGLPASIVV